MVSPLDISQNLSRLKSMVPAGIELVAVSKFQPIEAVKAAYEAGQSLFGESRVQELIEKEKALPADIRWHFIGHLQTNKVKALIGKTVLIESVDSERLLSLIDKESASAGIDTRVLLQVHVATEETKFGFSPDELLEFFREKRYKELARVKLCGLMAMATNTADMEKVRTDFGRASELFREISLHLAPELEDFKILSMGMSEDWPIAVEEGANLIRIGSAIFGARY